jgi:predicted dithiol-disulfide oxidoreductase (DUF899 family)
MLRTPDGQAHIDLVTCSSPSDDRAIQQPSANTLGIRPIAFAIEDIEAVVTRLKKNGAETFSEIQQEERMMNRPHVVSRAEWLVARQDLLTKEKEATRARDALAAARRRLPMVKIDKDYVFEGPDGTASLPALFDGRRQLILYHFMFAPGVEGWPEAGCPGCSMFTDTIGNLAHLCARDTALVLVARAPLANIERYRQRMGWTMPWFSSFGSDFNHDLGVTTDDSETFGLSVFLREGDHVFHTYYTSGRGVEGLAGITFLDLTPFGRQEDWEDSPAGWPQPPGDWWRRHDEYEDEGT